MFVEGTEWLKRLHPPGGAIAQHHKSIADIPK